jgi:hypothetical protein
VTMIRAAADVNPEETGPDMKSITNPVNIRRKACLAAKYVVLLKLKLIYDRQSAGQSVLESGAHLGPATNFPFSLKFPSDSS